MAHTRKGGPQMIIGKGPWHYSGWQGKHSLKKTKAVVEPVGDVK